MGTKISPRRVLFNFLLSPPKRWTSTPLFYCLIIFLCCNKVAVTIDQHDKSTTATTAASVATTISTSQQQCEQQTFTGEQPPDPYYDASEITITAAKKLAEYLATKTFNKINVRDRANELANEALLNDEGLVAVAIAAPSVSVAVVQFRDRIENTPENSNNHSYLSIYWKELGIAWNQTDDAKFWGYPFKDCGPLQGRWLWPFSVTVFSNGFKIVASAFIAADVDQCNDALEPIFGRRHSCDRETTFCLMSEPDSSSSRGKYTCVCKEGYYVPNETIQGFDSVKVELGNGNYNCIACPGGCFCDSNGVCLFGETEDGFSSETLLKTTIGSILGACMLCCLVLAIIVFRQRKCKTIATGMWTILETILFGILLLYSAVAIHFIPASSLRCLLEPWCRELGFIICYGAIVLKLYRHLVEFRTRKAHRYVVRDLDLLRYLCAMIVAVLCYLSAFTASCSDFLQYTELTWKNELSDNKQISNMCRPLKWDYVTEAGEMLILGFGLQLAYVSRNAITQFRERQFLVASITLEFIISSTYYIIRALYLSDFNPSTLFLALFLRSQLTNTITVGLIFLPKLWYQRKQVRFLAHDVSFGLPVDAFANFKGQHDGTHHAGGGLGAYAGICIGDPEAGDLTISEMSPEDIRSELKRLYTQLEYLKNKTLRLDNPHISKRRGGRKVAHRRFSLQALSAKHRNNRAIPCTHEIEVTEAEPSRTPEDSVCSVEGPTDTNTATGGEASGPSK